jgi:hypothetical protein
MGLLGACAAQPSELDGPVAYRAFSLTGSSRALQLAADGSASLHLTREAGESTDSSGTASAPALTALRDDIAAADLGSLSGDYTCSDLGCDEPTMFRTLVVESGGTTTQISVAGGISDARLPAGLAKVLQDLDAIAMQLDTGS